MISNQVLQTSIDELRAITRIDLCVMDPDGRTVAATFSCEDINQNMIESFAASAADSQVIRGYHFFKVYDNQVMEYILVAKGSNEDTYMIGKVAVSQIQNLMIAYKERFNRENFIQNLILDNLLLVDIYNRAKKLHIEVEARRVVFIIESKRGEYSSRMQDASQGQEREKNRYDTESISMETLKGMFASRTKDFITAVDERSIILVRELKEEESYGDLEEVGKIICDMLGAEAMTSVRVAYGTIVNEIKHISRSYKEAKMALDVGKIFYSEKNILSYNTLGIGRLIYQLPVTLCEIFIKETFGECMPDTFDEETLQTIQKFFENNLNVSETSRQLYVHRNTLVYRLEKLQKMTGLDIRVFEDALTFKIALMVVSYMKYMKDKPY